MEVVDIDTNEEVSPVEPDKEDVQLAKTGPQEQKHTEEPRHDSKAQNAFEQNFGYRLIKGIKTAMDDWYLDPLLGLIPGGWGDVITSICSIPFIAVALFYVKSIPLTIAILYNTLVDIVMGLIPFFVGDVLDIFSKSYKKNFDLIVGYVEGDHNIRREVKKKTFISSAVIVVFCVIIYFMVKWTIELGAYLWDVIFA